MDAAEIHGEFLIDEHPHIVVTYEGELVILGRIVTEPEPNLGRETEVVVLARWIGRPG